MSRQTLLCHPAIPCPVVQGITTDVRQTAVGDLMLTYRILARPENQQNLLIPTAMPAAAANNLWQHTCCEAFIGTTGDAAYREFNFSPSSLWAVYQFHDYRQPDTDFQAPAAPQIVLHCDYEQIVLEARLPNALLPIGNTWQIGLSAVIESTDGCKSYWALTHGTAQPDFHLRQSFTLILNRITT